MLTHFEGLRTKLLLMTFHDFLTRHFKKIHVFFKFEKRKIRILEHWSPQAFSRVVSMLNSGGEGPGFKS